MRSKRRSRIQNLILPSSAGGLGFSLPIMSDLVAGIDDRSDQWQLSNGSTPAGITDRLGRWDDLSGEDNHLSQATTAPTDFRPIVDVGKVANFDGAEDYMSADALATYAINNAAFTIYLAFLPTFTDIADRRFISFGRASSGNPFISLGQSTANKYRLLYRSDTAVLTNVSSAGDTTDDLQLITLLSDTSLKVRKNGTQIIDGAFPSGDLTLDQFSIGVHRTNILLGWTDMNVYGLYFYSTNHDAGQLSTMETYISNRFGIS